MKYGTSKNQPHRMALKTAEELGHRGHRLGEYYISEYKERRHKITKLEIRAISRMRRILGMPWHYTEEGKWK